MKSNISCDIVQDLLPGYVDGLTRDSVNDYVSNHLKNCKECKAVYEAMSENDEIAVISAENKNLMKKAKREINRKIIITSISIVVVIAIIISAVYWAIVPYVVSPKKVEFSIEQIAFEELNIVEKHSYSDSESYCLKIEPYEELFYLYKDEYEKAREQGYIEILHFTVEGGAKQIVESDNSEAKALSDAQILYVTMYDKHIINLKRNHDKYTDGEDDYDTIDCPDGYVSANENEYTSFNYCVNNLEKVIYIDAHRNETELWSR